MHYRHMDDPDKPSLLKHIDNFVRGLANGLTFGAADTIAAAADTIVTDRGGKQGESLGAAFDRNRIEQLQKTRQAHAETKDGVEAGEMLGSLGLGFGVFGLLKTGAVTSGAQYRELFTRAGSALAGRRPMLGLALLNTSLNRAMRAERAASAAAMGSTAISLAVNRTQHPDKNATGEVQPDARPRTPPRAP
jgi:hypothetical protein